MGEMDTTPPRIEDIEAYLDKGRARWVFRQTVHRLIIPRCTSCISASSARLGVRRSDKHCKKPAGPCVRTQWVQVGTGATKMLYAGRFRFSQDLPRQSQKPRERGD